MINIIEGNYDATGKRFAVVASRWNEFIVSKLIDGATDALLRHKVKPADITIIRCPGAFEIPLVVTKAANDRRYDAVIVLGAVIRGATPHFDYIAAEVTKGVAAVALDSLTPCTYGMLTTDNVEQAIDRAGTKSGNKGFEAAMSAIEMLSLLENMQEEMPF